MYVFACSPARVEGDPPLAIAYIILTLFSPIRVEGAGYVAWGHSSVINPWGEVISKAGSYLSTQ